MIWSSCLDPVPPIFICVSLPLRSLTAVRYSLAVLYGVSALTHRMNSSRARRAIGVRSFQLNGTPVWSGVVKRFDSVMIMVWPSPFSPLTWRKPSAPAPPDLFTTVIGRGESLCFSTIPAMRRAIWSAPPPVPAGMTNSMGLVGSQAASAGEHRNTTATRAGISAAIRRQWRYISPPCGRGVAIAAGGGGLFARTLLPERNNAGDLPLVPHRVHLGLEVFQIFLGEVGEAALLEQVLPHRLARAALHDGLRPAVVAHPPVLPLAQGADAGLHRQLAQLVREHRVVVPALRARIERVNERRAADPERPAGLAHHLDRAGGVHRGHVAAFRVARGQHARGVLLPAGVDDALHRARRAAPGGGSGGGG